MGGFQVGRIIQGKITGPASNTTLTCVVCDEDGNIHREVAALVAAVSNVLNLPGLGANSGATTATLPGGEIVIPPGGWIQFDAAAAAQNETLTICIDMWLNYMVEPTWATTGSGGTPSLAPGTVSTGNRFAAVVI